MRARAPRTLRRRLVLVLVAVLVLFSAALGTTSTLAIRTSLTDQLDDSLHAASERTSRFPAHRGEQQGGEQQGGAQGLDPGGTQDQVPSPQEIPDDVSPPPGQAAGTIGIEVRGDGTTAVAGYIDDDGAWQALSDPQAEALTGLPADGAVRTVDVPGLGTYRAIAADRPDGTTSVTAMSTADLQATLQRYVMVEIGLAVAGIALAGVAGTWLVRRSLRPLDAVADAATHVAGLPLDRGEVAEIPRVDAALTDPRTEVGQVGAALNRLLGHVESALGARHESETQVRRFVADASHELRTPLASIRGYAELVRRSPDDVAPGTLRSLDRIESESKRMGALVEDLLLLARLDAGRPLERAPVDLAGLAVDAVTDAHAAGPDHVWELDLPGGDDGDGAGGDGAGGNGAGRGGDDVVVPGDEMRLRQVFANLVGNARVHTPAGTRVVVGVRREGPEAVVTVSDDGPGVPAALAPTLFQRFSRGDSARNRTGGSTGLGLAIVQAVVQAHGGTIAVRSNGGEAEEGTVSAGTGSAGTVSAGTVSAGTVVEGTVFEGTVFEVRLPGTAPGA
ncbi:cell wall metabolism sensor histidine kinase WalK [Cellulomonas sp. PhB143]|uniref:sensor histidine kinase n=1 Tax=Cellulomonas sp. PhB143 TaxID=2485186 RepID=UPI001F1577B2|nr:HAMP domain-containing sensor histidine kinase [Cellulomonas sp. PhB143]